MPQLCVKDIEYHNYNVCLRQTVLTRVSPFSSINLSASGVLLEGEQTSAQALAPAK